MQNWYNLPVYYDVSFSHEMSDELAFLKAVFKKYCHPSRAKLLEPACGTGRLIVPLLRSGFDCTGFDLNEHALNYLSRKLERQNLTANIFNADMTNFSVKAKQYDAAFCTVDTFRHLLTETQAEQHLRQVYKSLKKDGIYILGLHLIPERRRVRNSVIRWTNRRGRLTVKTTMTMIGMDKKGRAETLSVELKAKGVRRSEKHISTYKLRTYTLKQFLGLLSKINIFKIEQVYDHYYDLSKPITLNKNSDYAVFLLRKA